MNKASYFTIAFCLLLLSANGQNSNLFVVEASSQYEEVYFSELLVEEDTFVWEIELFTMGNNTIDSVENSGNNLLEGSIVKLTILENMSNFNIINNYQDMISSFEMQIDGESIIPESSGITITFTISFNSTLASLSGIGFPIIWPVEYVYENSNLISFEEELNLRIGGLSAYTLEFSDNHLNYTYSSGIDFERYSFDRDSGVLISHHQYDSRVKLEFKMVLREFPSYIHATGMPANDVEILDEETEPVVNLPGFEIYYIFSLGIIIHLKRKLKD